MKMRHSGPEIYRSFWYPFYELKFKLVAGLINWNNGSPIQKRMAQTSKYPIGVRLACGVESKAADLRNTSIVFLTLVR